jgi:hypothetical protein
MVVIYPQPIAYIHNSHFIKELQHALRVGTWVATGERVPR